MTEKRVEFAQNRKQEHVWEDTGDCMAKSIPATPGLCKIPALRSEAPQPSTRPTARVACDKKAFPLILTDDQTPMCNMRDTSTLSEKTNCEMTRSIRKHAMCGALISPLLPCLGKIRDHAFPPTRTVSLFSCSSPKCLHCSKFLDLLTCPTSRRQRWTRQRDQSSRLGFEILMLPSE